MAVSKLFAGASGALKTPPFTHVANTVMAYGFGVDGKVTALDVYVMSLERAAEGGVARDA